jgi:hypothetical protein
MAEVLRKIEEARAAAAAQMRIATAAERQQIISNFNTTVIYLQGYAAALAEPT